MIKKASLLIVAAFMQGITFVLYPAAAPLLIDPTHHGLTAHQYGILFIPMILGTLFLSYSAGFLTEKKGHRALIIYALLFNALSVFTFAFTEFTVSFPFTNYLFLLGALLFLGLGYGAMLSILTPYMLVLFPKHANNATAAIYSVLCLGAACSPLFLHLTEKSGLWWLDPLIAGVVFLILIATTYLTLPGKEQESELFPPPKSKGALPPLPWLFWLFFVSMLLYGITVTVYSNWVTIYLHNELQFSTAISSYGLALFWGMIMLGRALIVGTGKWIPHRLVYVTLPLLAVIVFAITPLMHSATANLTLCALAGLAFSAIFPLIYSLSAQTFSERVPTVSGRLTAAYMLGVGITAYGVGFLYDILHISLKEIFFYFWIGALLLFILSVILMQNKQVKG